MAQVIERSGIQETTSNAVKSIMYQGKLQISVFQIIMIKILFTFMHKILSFWRCFLWFFCDFLCWFLAQKFHFKIPGFYSAFLMILLLENSIKIPIFSRWIRPQRFLLNWDLPPKLPQDFERKSGTPRTNSRFSSRLPSPMASHCFLYKTRNVFRAMLAIQLTNFKLQSTTSFLQKNNVKKIFYAYFFILYWY